MRGSREEIIDFVRGLAVIDMMLVHYRDFFESVPLIIVKKLIGFSDFAIEGFIFSAGFAVGYHYFSKFRTNRKSTTRRLLYRALNIVKIQYLMILTIGLFSAVLLGKIVTGSDTIAQYIVKSLLFLKQEGLLHILPTFVPLLILSIPMLHILVRGYGVVLLIVSLCFFAVGNQNPNIFSLGEKPIFPVILWQLYFVIGVLWGKRYFSTGKLLPGGPGTHLFVASAVLFIMMFVYFGHHFIPEWGYLRQIYGIKVSKFPLNYFGFLYHGAILYMIICLVTMGQKRGLPIIKPGSFIMLFGRNSLLTFVIHVYFVKFIVILNHFVPVTALMSPVIVGLNVITGIVAAKYVENRQERLTSYKVATK
ncbi:MAG: OpgC domain-containing protein [Nitrospirota bacterium]